MKSTGEVLGVGRTLEEALYKGFIGAGFKFVNKKGKILVTINEQDKAEFLEIAKILSRLNYSFLATKGTADMLRAEGIEVEEVRKINEENPNIIDAIKSGKVDMVINTPTKGNDSKRDGFRIRRAAIENNVDVVTALDTAKAIAEVVNKDFDTKDLEVFNIFHMEA